MAWEMVGPHMARVCSGWISGSESCDSQLGAGCSGWEQLGGWAVPWRGWLHGEFGERSCSQEKL